ncbi:hypothetical protein [Propionicicella superfundia]|uniref:hypothetical protein n=1 Tax=Propionicicella superfundia TaxID=348582 RepID=UPI00048A9BE0|nr:hypothetical protein [Propionicicella superfundia]
MNDALQRTARFVLTTGAVLLLLSIGLQALVPDWIAGYLLPPSLPALPANAISAIVGSFSDFSAFFFAAGVVLGVYCRFRNRAASDHPAGAAHDDVVETGTQPR